MTTQNDSYNTPRQMAAKFPGRCKNDFHNGNTAAPGIVARGDTILYSKGIGVVGCAECSPELAAAKAAPAETVEIVAQVDYIGFSKPDGSWTVTKAYLDPSCLPLAHNAPIDTDTEKFSLVGALGTDVKVDDVIRAFGTWVNDPKWGWQFKAQRAVPEVGGTEQDLAAFLTKMPGIGQARAREIIRILGGRDEVLDALGNHPEKLAQVPGITEAKAQEIGATYQEQEKLVESFLFCAKIGLGEAATKKAIDAWGADVQDVILGNPYDLMDLRGIGFVKADEVACQKLDAETRVANDDPRRCAAAILLALDMAEDEGHCWTAKDELTGAKETFLSKRVAKATGLGADLLAKGIAICEQPREVIRRGKKITLPPQVEVARVAGVDRVYRADVADAERCVAEDITRLASASVRQLDVPEHVFGGFEPDPAQAKAVQDAATNAVMVLTGGPGTGKTFTCDAVTRMYEANNGARIAFCAPTGKAAIRLAEQTGREATTIHRLLEYGPLDRGGMGFRRDVSNKIPADIIVVDESSMIDIRLFRHLVEAIRTGARLLIVGDVDQLPSIGPGRVLHDLITSSVLPVARLTKIFRQADESAIPWIARDINEGFSPMEHFADAPDARFDTAVEPEAVAHRIVLSVTKAKRFRPDQIQVLCPQKKGPIGVEALNNALQEQLNEHVRADNMIYIGGGYQATFTDRVIHTKNNYDLEVFNGEVGKIVACSPKGIAESVVAELLDGVDHPYSKSSQKLTKIIAVVDFGDRRVEYTRDAAKELHLAYAITIHKSQGSQFPCVVVPAHQAHSFMLTRALLYTAITRAQEFVYCIGQPEMLERAAKNRRGTERRTALQELLHVGAGGEAPSAEGPATLDAVAVSELI